jgi:hypothetical protein
VAKKTASKPNKSVDLGKSDQKIDDIESSSVETVIESKVSGQISEETPEENLNKQGMSVSSKLLTGVALIALGGVASLFFGPKIAPSLPAGMAPVAQFLSPGSSNAETKIAALSATMDQRLAALENAPKPEPNTEIKQKIAELSTRITDLSDQVAASDSGDIEARLTGAETKLSGLSAWVDQTDERLLTGDAGSSDNSASLAIIEGLRAELAAIAAKQGQIDQQIDQVKAATDRRVGEAEEKVVEVIETTSKTIGAVERDKAITAIRAAIDSGSQFAEPLSVLSESNFEIPQVLSQAAFSGVPSFGQLNGAFSAAAHAALKADIKEQSDTGVANKLAGFFKSQVTVRSLEAQEGETVDAILSRMNAFLNNEDLSAAVAQSAGLTPTSQSAMQGWLDDANLRNDVINAVNALSQE